MEDNLSENEHLTLYPDPENFAKIRFLPKPNAHFSWAYSALAALEKEKQDFAVATKVTPDSYFILIPKTTDKIFVLRQTPLQQQVS